MKDYNGQIIISRAKKDGRYWQIGGDYDYRHLVMILDLTDGIFYKWCNGRLKYQDHMTEEQRLKFLEQAYGEV